MSDSLSSRIVNLTPNTLNSTLDCLQKNSATKRAGFDRKIRTIRGCLYRPRRLFIAHHESGGSRCHWGSNSTSHPSTYRGQKQAHRGLLLDMVVWRQPCDYCTRVASRIRGDRRVASQRLTSGGMVVSFLALPPTLQRIRAVLIDQKGSFHSSSSSLKTGEEPNEALIRRAFPADVSLHYWFPVIVSQ